MTINLNFIIVYGGDLGDIDATILSIKDKLYEGYVYNDGTNSIDVSLSYEHTMQRLISVVTTKVRDSIVGTCTASVTLSEVIYNFP